jgi:hypothetical protein
MKHLINFSAILLSAILLTNCTISHTESGKQMSEEVRDEINTAQKAITLIKNGKSDSVKAMMNIEVLEKTTPEVMEWVMKEGQSMIVSNETPLETMITYTQTSQTKNGGAEQLFIEFKIPYYHKTSTDSSGTFNIKVSNGELYKLSISGPRAKTLYNAK